LSVEIPMTPISSLSVEDGLLEERTAGGKISSSFSIVMGVLLPPNLRTKVNMGLFKVFLQTYPLLHKCIDNAVQINILVANPTSRGYIKALSPNIVETPEIDPNFLTTEEDKASSARAQRKSVEYFEKQSLKKYARQSTGPSLECGLLIDFPTQASSARSSSLHLFGGATYGKVLEKDFSVKGVNNLYVIDASIFPRATEINPFNTIAAFGAFVAQEHVTFPANTPTLPPRVQLTNKQEPNKCMAIGSPIYAHDCDHMTPDTTLWIQEADTGKYVTTEIVENKAYLIRSGLDDRYCVYHYLGGLTTKDLCNTKLDNQKVFFVKKGDFFQVKFSMFADSGPCMMKWWGSNTVSGFSCSFPQTDRLQWKVKVLDGI